MQKKNLGLSLFATVFVALSFFVGTALVSPASAVEQDITVGIPTFGTCPNPGGQLIVEHETGQHQIPGNGLLEGSDHVYQVGDKLFVQCFCPENEGAGIQSNWIHEQHLTPEQESYLLSLGYLKIDNGSAWGLPEGTYYVNNIAIDCDGQICPNNGTDIRTEIKRRLSVKVNNYNHANISSYIRAIANSGNNTSNGNIGGSNINTGSAYVNAEINNNLNQNTTAIEVNGNSSELQLDVVNTGNSSAEAEMEAMKEQMEHMRLEMFMR